ncbi:MAG: hypothetical protein HC904_09505 [Blastochloris sp.]|nr:hypothetical protein [Blastochloris sp.]
MELQTGNQGVWVFLDNSGSMEAISQKVEAMALESFPDAEILKVSGALFATEKSLDKLKRQRGSSDFYVTYYQSQLPRSIMTRILEKLSQPGPAPESIYFLSDFADFVDDSAVNDLSELLKSKGVKFFAHSVGKDPDGAIKSLARQSGGQSIKTKIE